MLQQENHANGNLTKLDQNNITANLSHSVHSAAHLRPRAADRPIAVHRSPGEDHDMPAAVGRAGLRQRIRHSPQGVPRDLRRRSGPNHDGRPAIQLFGERGRAIWIRSSARSSSWRAFSFRCSREIIGRRQATGDRRQAMGDGRWATRQRQDQREAMRDSEAAIASPTPIAIDPLDPHITLLPVLPFSRSPVLPFSRSPVPRPSHAPSPGRPARSHRL